MTSADFAWMIEHGPEIYKQYAGKWIAVHDGRIVGVGETATEAAKAARAEIGNDEFILEAVDRESDVIYAGLSLATAAKGVI